MRSRLLFIPLLALAITACDGATGPCDQNDACIVEGVDLVVEPATVVEWPGMQVDSITGLPVIRPGDSVVVESLVRNRGDEASEPMEILVCFESESGGCWSVSDWLRYSLRTVLPGQEARDTFRLAAPYGATKIRMSLPELEAEREYLNNESETPVFAAVPRVGGMVTGMPAEIRIGERITLDVRIDNIGRYTDIPAASLFICVIEYDTGGCGAEDPRVYRMLMPTIPDGRQWRGTVTFVVPVEAMYGGVEFQRPAVRFIGCLGYDSYLAERPYYGCADAENTVRLLPDLDYTCNAAAIAPDTIIAGQTQPDLCSVLIGDDAEVWSFEAEAGETFTVEFIAAEGVYAHFEVVDHDGDWNTNRTDRAQTFTVPATGRYHIVVVDAGEYSLSFTRD